MRSWLEIISEIDRRAEVQFNTSSGNVYVSFPENFKEFDELISALKTYQEKQTK